MYINLPFHLCYQKYALNYEYYLKSTLKKVHFYELQFCKIDKTISVSLQI